MKDPIRDALIKARAEKRITQVQAAQQCNISEGAYKEYETGKHRYPSVVTLVKFMRFTGLTAEELIDFDRMREECLID